MRAHRRTTPAAEPGEDASRHRSDGHARDTRWDGPDGRLDLDALAADMEVRAVDALDAATAARLTNGARASDLVGEWWARWGIDSWPDGSACTVWAGYTVATFTGACVAPDPDETDEQWQERRAARAKSDADYAHVTQPLHVLALIERLREAAPTAATGDLDDLDDLDDTAIDASLCLEGFRIDEKYPEHGHDALRTAYRAGYEDARAAFAAQARAERRPRTTERLALGRGERDGLR